MRHASTLVLLVASLVIASLSAGLHDHEPLAAAAHPELPTLAAGHSQPDRTVHIEGATGVESSLCVGCLHRQRQRGLAALESNPGAPRISRLRVGATSAGDPAAGLDRLPGGRAPPRA